MIGDLINVMVANRLAVNSGKQPTTKTKKDKNTDERRGHKSDLEYKRGKDQMYYSSVYCWGLW